MRTIGILAEAAEEAAEASAWYEKERVGLGAEFHNAIEAALDLLEDESFPLLSFPNHTEGSPKRIILRRFPYDLVVIDRLPRVIVVAVAHHSRKPGYWVDRL